MSKGGTGRVMKRSSVGTITRVKGCLGGMHGGVCLGPKSHARGGRRHLLEARSTTFLIAIDNDPGRVRRVAFRTTASLCQSEISEVAAPQSVYNGDVNARMDTRQSARMIRNL